MQRLDKSSPSTPRGVQILLVLMVLATDDSTEGGSCEDGYPVTKGRHPTKCTEDKPDEGGSLGGGAVRVLLFQSFISFLTPDTFA